MQKFNGSQWSGTPVFACLGLLFPVYIPFLEDSIVNSQVHHPMSESPYRPTDIIKLNESKHNVLVFVCTGVFSNFDHYEELVKTPGDPHTHSRPISSLACLPSYSLFPLKLIFTCSASVVEVRPCCYYSGLFWDQKNKTYHLYRGTVCVIVVCLSMILLHDKSKITTPSAPGNFFVQ